MLIVLLVSQIIARYILLPTLALKSDWVVKYRKCQGGARYPSIREFKGHHLLARRGVRLRGNVFCRDAVVY